MRIRPYISVIIYLILASSLMAQGRNRDDRPQPPQRQPRGPQGIFHTEVPDHPFDIILVRPTATSITVSILSQIEIKAYISYGTTKDTLSLHTDPCELKQGIPQEIILSRLKPETQYFYQVRNFQTNKPFLESDNISTFHTQRLPGSPFTFTVQADSHLDENTSPDLYRQTLRKALADAPDFHIDLGDTFMTDKHSDRASAARQYLAQRYYLGLIGQSAPVFLVLGNHDGEEGKLRGGTDSLSLWSNTMRKRYFPDPIPDDFYTGNSARDPEAGLLQDYYAWHWGDALFVVLDPYWYASARRNDDGWGLTLGKTQYDWLRQTLSASRDKFKFIFIHQLVGGLDEQGRGGIEAVPFGEWGGKNRDGSSGFAQHRPGWETPIHELLVRNHVTMVFHGHDHLFAKQELDGIIYQEVPQPAFSRKTRPGFAAEAGYISGNIEGGTGYIRVKVQNDKVVAEFIRTSESD